MSDIKLVKVLSTSSSHSAGCLICDVKVPQNRLKPQNIKGVWDHLGLLLPDGEKCKLPAKEGT